MRTSSCVESRAARRQPQRSSKIKARERPFAIGGIPMAPWGDGRRETTVAGAAAMMSVDVGAGGSPMLHEHAEEADEPDF